MLHAIDLLLFVWVLSSSLHFRKCFRLLNEVFYDCFYHQYQKRHIENVCSSQSLFCFFLSVNVYTVQRTNRSIYNNKEISTAHFLFSFLLIFWFLFLCCCFGFVECISFCYNYRSFPLVRHWVYYHYSDRSKYIKYWISLAILI